MNNEPHSKTLFQLKLFWAAATIPIAAGIFLSLLVSNQANLLLDFTPDGMAYFWENFQLSIWIMGLSIPLVVMVASHHRSVQTAAQIKSQKEQNTFANYFEHRREFKNEVREYFNKYLNQSRGYLPEIFTLNLLHSRVFPNVPEGNYEVDLDFWEEVRHFVVMFYQEGLYKIFFTENGSSIFEITGDNFKRPQMIAHIHFSDVYQNLILTTVQSFSQLTEHSVSEFQFSSPSNNLDFKPIYEFSKSIERFYRLIRKCYQFNSRPPNLTDDLAIQKLIDKINAPLDQVRKNIEEIIQTATDIDKFLQENVNRPGTEGLNADGILSFYSTNDRVSCFHNLPSYKRIVAVRSPQLNNWELSLFR